VFEADFFALYNDHDPKNLFPIWSKSVQCQDLFDFLKKQNVTIWGFDDQFSSIYSFKNFCPMLFNFLDENKIPYEPSFKTQTEKAVQSGPKINQKLNEKDFSQLFAAIDTLLENAEVQKNHFWAQTLMSFKNSVRQNASYKKLAIETRDKQMASNLNFLTSENKNKKFLVWAANAHISKLDLPFMNKQTMGFQYCQLNPDITYHIAFSSIRMPYRKEKWIEVQRNNANNLLWLLPSISENYYIDSKDVKRDNLNLIEEEFDGMFGPPFKHTTYFKHFDALVFIANGEKSRSIE
jgi:erythromycin esterase